MQMTILISRTILQREETWQTGKQTSAKILERIAKPINAANNNTSDWVWKILRKGKRGKVEEDAVK